MDPLSFTASLIAVIQLTSSLLTYLNSIKDAPKDRAQCALEASNLQNLLTMLRYRLEESQSDEPWYVALKTLAVDNGPLEQYRQALDKILQRISATSGSSKLGKSLIWCFRRDDVQALLERIGRLKTIISIALEMDHFKLSQAMKADLRVIQDGAEGIKLDTNAILKALPPIEARLDDLSNDQLRSDIAAWLSSIKFGPQHADLIARKNQDTGLWFLESAVFADWLDGPDRTLFCPGIPGAGKTMIAAITVEHLLRMRKTDRVGVAFIYCNYKLDADATATGLLSSVLKQLLLGLAQMPDEIIHMYRAHRSDETTPSLDEISSSLRVVLNNYSRSYIVVDALDECPDSNGARSQAIKTLQNLQGDGRLSLMFTSRSIPDVQAIFAAVPTLEIRATREDVERYLKGQIHRLPKCVQTDRDLQDLVITTLAEAVDGMFLLARLYLDSLMDKRTKSKVRLALQSMSQGSHALEEAYRGAVERIEGQLHDDSVLAKQVITWITYAKRPLRPIELCHALAVAVDDTVLDFDNVPDVDDLIAACAGLVTLDEEADIIRLVHYTTHEFFEEQGQGWFPDPHLMIASTCITYLSLDIPRKQVEAIEGPVHGLYPYPEMAPKLVEGYYLLPYAAYFWSLHAWEVQAAISDLALPFLLNRKSVKNTMEVLSQSQPLIWPLEDWTGLHLVSMVGLHHLLDLVLRCVPRLDINAATTCGFTPLVLAVTEGHEGAVVVLLSHGADPNADGPYGNSLFLASEAGHEGIVKLLLSRDDIDVNAMNVFPVAPLHVAVTSQRFSVAQLLLQDKRTDVNKTGSKGKGWYDVLDYTALALAVERNNVDMVQLLLSHPRVDPNMTYGGHGLSPLARAASLGRKEIVELLLANPLVQPDIVDDAGRSAVWHAIHGNHPDIADLLVVHSRIGSNVDAADTVVAPVRDAGRVPGAAGTAQLVDSSMPTGTASYHSMAETGLSP